MLPRAPAGAHAGKKLSNAYILDKLGWQGERHRTFCFVLSPRCMWLW
jgi:hypothetical protein